MARAASLLAMAILIALSARGARAQDAALVEAAKNAQRDDLRGLATAALWDAGKKELARDLARSIGKKVQFETSGEETDAWRAAIQLLLPRSVLISPLCAIIR